MRRLAMLFALAVWVSACGAGQPPLSQPAKTKQQADVELQTAWKDGWLPFRRSEYPPAQATLERNKKRYAAKRALDVPLAASATNPSK